jgi:hypothetical protein
MLWHKKVILTVRGSSAIQSTDGKLQAPRPASQQSECASCRSSPGSTPPSRIPCMCSRRSMIKTAAQGEIARMWIWSQTHVVMLKTKYTGDLLHCKQALVKKHVFHVQTLPRDAWRQSCVPTVTHLRSKKRQLYVGKHGWQPSEQMHCSM